MIPPQPHDCVAGGGNAPSLMLLLLQDRRALPGQQGSIASDCHILVERKQLKALLYSKEAAAGGDESEEGTTRLTESREGRTRG